jgi:hypothetical protein
VTLGEKGFEIEGRKDPLPYTDASILIGDIKIRFDPKPHIDNDRRVTYWRGLDVQIDTDKEIHLIYNDKIYTEKD